MRLDESDQVLLKKGMERLNEANAIMRFLSDYFRDKYNLTPENQIVADGTIITLPSTHPVQNTGNNENGNSLSDVRSDLAMFGNTRTGET